MRKWPFSFIFIIYVFSCSMMVLDSDILTTEISGVRVYVENSRKDILAPTLELYKSDIVDQGYRVEITGWEGDSSVLRSELQNWTDGTWCAFFVGDMPHVSYKISTEIFPTDLYFSSPSTSWSDSNDDGVFDGHNSLSVTVPVSRITGTNSEIDEYFLKIHRYRSGDLSFSSAGTIFKDDDWSDYRKGSSFGMDYFLNKIDLIESLPNSTYVQYSDVVNRGQTYLYQWIHANPQSLYVQEGSSYNRFRFSDINTDSVDVGFINMFDCEAARYTQPNLGMTYLTQTDTTLAVMGSTKKGGNFEPLEFHRSLATDNSWSESYRQWYNTVGVHDDMWYLGMVILGDPLLQPHMEKSKSVQTDLQRLVPPTEEDREYYFSLLNDFVIPQ